jgi:hypothetical protein
MMDGASVSADYCPLPTPLIRKIESGKIAFRERKVSSLSYFVAAWSSDAMRCRLQGNYQSGIRHWPWAVFQFSETCPALDDDASPFALF